MYDKAQILARLQNGENAQDIANEIADLLNEAVAEHAETEEAKRLQAAKEAEKIKAADLVAEHGKVFLKTYYPDLYVSDFETATGKDLIKFVDDMLHEYYEFKKSIGNLDQLIADLEKMNIKPKAEKPKVKAKKDPVAEFLEMYVGE